MFRPVAQLPLDYSVFKDKKSVFSWAPSGAILFGNGASERTGTELPEPGSEKSDACHRSGTGEIRHSGQNHRFN